MISQDEKKVSVPMETWNCDSNPKIHAFWIYQSASSRQMLVQASLEDYELGTKKILGLSGLGSKKTNSKYNHCWLATKASHKSGDPSLLHFCCILSFSRVQHILLLLICTQIWITPHFWEQTYQWCFWLPWNQRKLQKKESNRYDDP